MEEETKQFSWKRVGGYVLAAVIAGLIVLAIVSGVAQGFSALFS